MSTTPSLGLHTRGPFGTEEDLTTGQPMWDHDVNMLIIDAAMAPPFPLRQRTVQFYEAQNPALPNGATESAAWQIAEFFSVMKVAVSAPCRVRLYCTPAMRDADVNRPAGTNPTGDHGVIMDILLNNTTGLSWILAPQATGQDAQATPNGQIAYNLTNLSGATADLQVALTFLSGEYD